MTDITNKLGTISSSLKGVRLLTSDTVNPDSWCLLRGSGRRQVHRRTSCLGAADSEARGKVCSFVMNARLMVNDMEAVVRHRQRTIFAM